MRIFTFDAKYAPMVDAILRDLRELERVVRTDANCRVFADDPTAIDAGLSTVIIDPARTGTIVFAIGECPADEAAKVFELSARRRTA